MNLEEENEEETSHITEESNREITRQNADEKRRTIRHEEILKRWNYLKENWWNGK